MAVRDGLTCWGQAYHSCPRPGVIDSDGITATGIDTIARHAGVARKSLYHNFASKAALVAAYLEARHAE